MKKLHSRKGETLTETLVAVLIVGISSVILFTMVSAGGRILRNSDKAYKEIYAALSNVEKQEAENSSPNGSVTFAFPDSGYISQSITVDACNENGLYAYTYEVTP